jgi:hypothetical protein
MSSISPPSRSDAEARYPELSLLIGGDFVRGNSGSSDVFDPATENKLSPSQAKLT